MPRYQPIHRANIEETGCWARLSKDERFALKVVSAVLPFRTNEHVVNELIDWDNVPHDPMFQLTFPQRGMLDAGDYERIAGLVRRSASATAIEREAQSIRQQLNPHPGGQLTHNVPRSNGVEIDGLQHKYASTVLYFPAHGQTCHAYCSFCFRWAQFVDAGQPQMASQDSGRLVEYLRTRREVTDVLITGGDPLVMRASVLARHLEPLLDAQLDHVTTIRIGTKAPLFWPHRFLSERDSDELLRLMERVGETGRRLAIMLHASHPVELANRHTQEALRRLRGVGALVFLQSPVVRHVNDDPAIWRELWSLGVELGAVPYYMFVERDTGARRYFEVPLLSAWQIYRTALEGTSGLVQTVRGPVMSASPGKVRFSGPTNATGTPAFALEFVQARESALTRRPFFAQYDPRATWFDQLEPLTESDRPFFDRSSLGDDGPVVSAYSADGLTDEHA